MSRERKGEERRGRKGKERKRKEREGRKGKGREGKPLWVQGSVSICLVRPVTQKLFNTALPRRLAPALTHNHSSHRQGKRTLFTSQSDCRCCCCCCCYQLLSELLLELTLSSELELAASAATAPPRCAVRSFLLASCFLRCSTRASKVIASCASN